MASVSDCLVGHWRLAGDCLDHSGNGNNGVNVGVDLKLGTFDGRGHYIEVADSPSLALDRGDFSFCAWIFTDREVDDVHGDLASKFDSHRRRGFNIGVTSSAGAYNSIGSDRRLAFGIDDGKDGAWRDCGKPNPTSTVLTTLTVFDGSLYVGSNNVRDPVEASRVYRYIGSDQWEDCGRVGFERTQGVGPMITHDGDLYAATWNIHRSDRLWTFGTDEKMWPDESPGRVYRYAGGKHWEDCGQPGQCPRLTSLASYRGRLYVMGLDDGADYISRCYVYEGGQEWTVCGEFENRAFPMAVHDGRLFTAHKSAPVLTEEKGARVFAYDGERWEDLGVPLLTHSRCAEIHCLEVFGGAIHAGANPLGRIVKLDNGVWRDVGELGDSREPMAFASYNGKFYAGSLQWADVYRQDRDDQWSLVRRFLEEEIDPGLRIPGILIARDRKVPWVRITSLTTFGGELFASTGSAWGDFSGPHGIRGRVYRFRAGQNAAFDRDMGPGWKHIAAVKSGRQLHLYVNGVRVAASAAFDPADYLLSNDRSLKLGSGETDSFRGRMRDVRLYRCGLAQHELTSIRNESEEPQPG